MSKILRCVVLICLCVGLLVIPVAMRGEDAITPSKGQRIYSIGHSFHVFMPKILDQIAKTANIAEHKQVGLSSIGGSYVIQHWDVADDKFKSKAVLNSGELDVLTMAALYLPDEGIENFVQLAAEKSPHIRVLVQEFWLPFDVNVNFRKEKVSPPTREVYDGKKLQAEHDAYFAELDAHVRMLNEKYGDKPRVFVAPVGQAVLALREQITAGTVPGLTKQEQLFTDSIGHAKPPLQVLVAYVYFAQIYGRSPVGLPVPAALNGTFNEETTAKVNRVLQEIAWKAVTGHPLSGVAGK